jgi:hypothetical protein
MSLRTWVQFFCSTWALSSFLYGRPRVNWIPWPWQVPVQVGVDELGAVVGVDAPEHEGQREAHLLEHRLHAGLAFAEDGPGLHPRGVDVGEVERVEGLPVGALAGVGDQVRLREAGGRRRPAVRPQRDVVLQERARLRPAVEASPHAPPGRLEPAVHLPGAEGEQLRLERRREAKPPPRPGQPQREEGPQADRPGVAGRRPDGRQDPDDLRTVARGARPSVGVGAPRWRAVEEPDGVLPVVARNLAELVQDLPLERSGGVAVAAMDGLEVLPLGLVAHDVTLL